MASPITPPDSPAFSKVVSKFNYSRRSSGISVASMESTKLQMIGPHVANDDSSDSGGEVVESGTKIDLTPKWNLKRPDYNLKGRKKFIENTLGIHFEEPYNYKSLLTYTLDEHGQLYFLFTVLVSFAAIYSFVTVPIRTANDDLYLLPNSSCTAEANSFLLEDNKTFHFLDLLVDILYLFDILFCQSRVQFVSKTDGNTIDSFRETLKRYLKKFSFYIDVLAVAVPFIDVIQYFFTDFHHPLLRCLRLFKMLRVWQFGSLIERKFSFAQIFRQFKALFQVVLLSNLIGSLFFLYYRNQSCSKEGIFQNFELIENRNMDPHPIMFSFYWGFVMATNIHNQARPVGAGQFVFMIVCHFIGALNMAYLYAVFVSSLRIKNWQRKQFLVKSQRAKQIFKLSKIPPTDPSQQKAADYFEYGYDNRIDILEKTILSYFPKKLGLNVYKESYYAIVTKPEIFKRMSPSFFNYLIPRMENHYFLPGEYIYQFNEVAKEMFIITKGSVEILEQLGSGGQIFPTEIRKGESFGFKELFADEDERKRTGDARTLGFVHCIVILRRDLDIITKTYLSENDTRQMKKNMESVKGKFFQDKLKHARDRKWSEMDALNVDEHIQNSLMQALKMLQVLLKLRKYMLAYVVVDNSDSEEQVSLSDLEIEGNLEELISPEARPAPKKISPSVMRNPKILEKNSVSRTLTTLASISEFPSEISIGRVPVKPPKMRFISKQTTAKDSEV